MKMDHQRHRLGRLAVLAATAGLFACSAPVAAPEPTLNSIQSETVGQTLSTQGGVVVSSNEIASRVGAQVLAEGGNAVDAAVATGFALAVVHPTAGNIGGGGFMVIRMPDGTATTIDFREKAPLAAHPEMFVDESGEYSRDVQANSHLAVGVPGTVAGFALAHERYGDAPWADLVEPAVALAEGGIVLSEDLSGSLARQVTGPMQRYPASVRAFARADGTPYAEGETWSQPDLARTLQRIMQDGREGFYGGETAMLLVAEMERGGGIITAEDLARYEAQEREPIRGAYRDYGIISMPPPSSGGVALVQMLNILEGFDLKGMGHGSAAHLHHVTEAQRLAFRDRARHLGDTDFVEVPIERLTSKEYATELRSQVDPSRAGVSAVEDITMPGEGTHTTHYSVVDENGIAVAVTYTLEAGYGSNITVEGAGFLLNNEMGDFNPWPGLTTEMGQIGTEANLTRPEQRMLSSMTPTIVERNGELVAVIGSPGGRTIINTVLHLVLNLAEFEMAPDDVVAAPRSHHQWLPDRISIEGSLDDAAVVSALQQMGHEVRVGGVQGSAQSVFVDPLTGQKIGVPDRRGGDAGAAVSR